MLQYDIPILLITFNRPDCTQKVLEKILQVRPKLLFIFSDGPRENIPNEGDLVQACRKQFEDLKLDWECQIERWFSSTNMGCGKGVSSAITKAFESVDKLIILEDDCLPHSSFFSYCKHMLDKYEKDERVMHIAGTRWNEEFDIGESDHFFSRIGHVWGWATWKRAWQKYDYDMKAWKTYNKMETANLFNSKRIGEFWNNKFEYAINNPQILNTWDYQWQFALFYQGGISVNPKVNLISNIGPIGAHGSGVSFNLFKEVKHWDSNSTKPKQVLPLLSYDQYHMKNHFMKKPTIISRVVNKIRKIYN